MPLVAFEDDEALLDFSFRLLSSASTLNAVIMSSSVTKCLKLSGISTEVGPLFDTPLAVDVSSARRSRWSFFDVGVTGGFAGANCCPEAMGDFGVVPVEDIEDTGGVGDGVGPVLLEGEAGPSTGANNPRSLSVTGELLTRAGGAAKGTTADEAESDTPRCEDSTSGVFCCWGEDAMPPDGTATCPVAFGPSA